MSSSSNHTVALCTYSGLASAYSVIAGWTPCSLEPFASGALGLHVAEQDPPAHPDHRGLRTEVGRSDGAQLTRPEERGALVDQHDALGYPDLHLAEHGVRGDGDLALLQHRLGQVQFHR